MDIGARYGDATRDVSACLARDRRALVEDAIGQCANFRHPAREPLKRPRGAAGLPSFDVHRLKSIGRSVRLFLLIWALLLGPQTALVHALSHTLPGAPAHPSQQDDEDRQHHARTICDTCLAFAQLATALPPAFGWRTDSVDIAAAASLVAHAAARHSLLAFQARAPPAASI